MIMNIVIALWYKEHISVTSCLSNGTHVIYPTNFHGLKFCSFHDLALRIKFRIGL